MANGKRRTADGEGNEGCKVEGIRCKERNGKVQGLRLKERKSEGEGRMAKDQGWKGLRAQSSKLKGKKGISRQEIHAVKIAYYPDTDSMYIDFSAKSSVESKEVSSGVVLDFDSDGNIVGIDIDNASKKLDLSEIILNKIPADKKTIAA